jgi:hypothetical protein
VTGLSDGITWVRVRVCHGVMMWGFYLALLYCTDNNCVIAITTVVITTWILSISIAIAIAITKHTVLFVLFLR